MKTPELMKASLALLLLCTATRTHAQSADALLQKGKQAFKTALAQVDTPGTRPDFSGAVTLLQKAVKAGPNNQEAHYFLGYAYDKETAAFGENMLQMRADKSIRSSIEFEKVIQIAPWYTGEKMALDPYSKIAAIWGSQAMAYWAADKADSIQWAFNESRKRGGLGSFTLLVYRNTLQHCEKNALLFSLGDIPTFSFQYLQQAEKIRPDVTVVDMSLLHTTWYDSVLYHREPALFGMAEEELHELSYTQWQDSVVTIPYGNTGRKLKWTVKPNYGNMYLLRGDRVMLDMLQQNRFVRPVYIVQPIPDDYGLSLDLHLKDQFYYSKVAADINPEYAVALKHAQAFPLDSVATVNKYSDDEMTMATAIRGRMLIVITALVSQQKKAEARRLMGELKRTIPETVFPYPSDEYRSYVAELDKKLSQ